MMRLHQLLHRAERRALARFNRWFCSEGGVYQTFIVVLAVVIFELADRGVDPHAFILMAVLTVYSAVTQPALAYAATEGSVSVDRRIDGLEAKIDALVARLPPE